MPPSHRIHPCFQPNLVPAGDGRFIDPTDESGMPSPYPGPGSPWPFPVKVLLPYANEPPKGAGGTNCFVETGVPPFTYGFLYNSVPVEICKNLSNQIHANDEWQVPCEGWYSMKANAILNLSVCWQLPLFRIGRQTGTYLVFSGMGHT
eukprot:1160086-Pelagomonas_calceolata.AAC.1